MRLTALAAAAILAAASAAPLTAAPFSLDKSHTTVTFSVDHLGFSTVHGVFREFDAEIDFDPENVEAATVSFTIAANSVDTFWEARDKHLMAADFLDVENHPEITFTSTKVEKIDDETAKVTGELTMLGETHEEVLEVKLNKMGPSPFNPDQQVAGFTVTGEIDRTKYGMGYGAPAIGATIPLRVDFEMSPAQAG